MRKGLVAAIVGIGLLAGCGLDPEYVARAEAQEAFYTTAMSEGVIVVTGRSEGITESTVKYNGSLYECISGVFHRRCHEL